MERSRDPSVLASHQPRPGEDARLLSTCSGPSHAQRNARSPKQAIRKPSSRGLWPPQPFAEEERVSLSREAPPFGVRQDVEVDASPNRGTVDQEPVIINIPQEQQEPRQPAVVAAQAPLRRDIPTQTPDEPRRVDTSQRQNSTIGGSEMDHLSANGPARASAPYAFSKPSDLNTRVAAASNRLPTDPPHLRYSSHKDGRSDSMLSLGANERVPSDYQQHYSNRTSNAKSPAVSRRPTNDQTWTLDSHRSPEDATSLAHTAVPVRKLNLDARRNTDGSTLPTLAKLSIAKPRKNSPLVSSNSLSEVTSFSPTALGLPSTSLSPHVRSRESSFTSSRGPSPAGSIHNGATPPSRSPRLSSDLSRDRSAQASRQSSAPNSRPTSPSPRSFVDSPRFARPDLDWDTLLAANAVRRAKPPSRLSASLYVDALDGSPQSSSSRHGTQSGSLPYPEDASLMGGGISMPEEYEHAYFPSKNATHTPTIANEGQTTSISASPSPSTSSRGSAIPAIRPFLTRAYSATTVASSEPRSAEEARPPRPSELTRSESFASSSDAKRELSKLMKRGLPPCTRPEPLVGYDDWYTVSGATNIDFCPDCIQFFERTIFRSHFRRSLPRNLDSEVRCAFGSPWIRLAWLLTLQQHRTDLILLKDVAEIEETASPCPGTVETVQTWYGLRDVDGLFVRNFHICYADVRKIERLLPTLVGLFVKLPQRVSLEKHRCAIRTDSNRFSAYLDSLVSTHERAVFSRKAADPMPLVELVEHRTRLRECTRDNMLIGGLWHFIPDIPSLTVCEDCFESVIEPEIKNESPLARRFNRTVQPVHGEGMGSSCQLYSRRMRKVFQRAVEDSDLRYLSRKSRERRDMELRLQEKYKEITRKVKYLSVEGDEADQRRLAREMEHISHTWKTKWE